MQTNAKLWTTITASLLVLIMITGGGAAQPDPIADVCHETSPEQALSHGYAVPIRVRVLAETAQPIRTTNTLFYEPVRTSSSVQGPGKDADERRVLNLETPQGGNLARLQLLAAKTDANVDERLFAHTTSYAEVANVSLLNGDIKASILKARANTRTTHSMADVTGNGTAALNVEILGRVHENVAPNTRIPLPADRFGVGSWVKLYERVDIGLFPYDEQPWYVAEQTIRMIHVRATNVAGIAGPVDIVVAEAHAFSQTPTPYCAGIQGINASAYGIRIKDAPYMWSPSIKVGYVKVAHTGGWNEQAYNNVSVQTQSHVATVEAITSRATGVVDLGVISKSTASTKLTNVCIAARDGNTDHDCLVRATAIRAEANSQAWHDRPNSTNGPDYDATSWGESYILNLVIAGVDLCEELGLNNVTIDGQTVGCQPPKNTKLTIKNGVADLTVLLNERQRDFDPEGHTEYIVRAVRIDGTLAGEPISVTLGRAYTEADYGTTDDS